MSAERDDRRPARRVGVAERDHRRRAAAQGVGASARLDGSLEALGAGRRREADGDGAARRDRLEQRLVDAPCRQPDERSAGASSTPGQDVHAAQVLPASAPPARRYWPSSRRCALSYAIRTRPFSSVVGEDRALAPVALARPRGTPSGGLRRSVVLGQLLRLPAVALARGEALEHAALGDEHVAVDVHRGHLVDVAGRGQPAAWPWPGSRCRRWPAEYDPDLLLGRIDDVQVVRGRARGRAGTSRWR